jgi:hypothetical protein
MNLPNVYCDLCKATIAINFAGTDLLFGGRSIKLAGDPGHESFELGDDPHAERHLCSRCIARMKNTFTMNGG